MGKIAITLSTLHFKQSVNWQMKDAIESYKLFHINRILQELITDEIPYNKIDAKISQNISARYEAPPRNGLAEALPYLMNVRFKLAEPRSVPSMLAGLKPQLKNHPSYDYILFPPIYWKGF